MPMAKPTIQVTIAYDSKGEGCNVDCGVDWSSAEVITLTSQRIKERFGDRVELEYVDLSKPGTNLPKLNQALRNKNQPLPLLVIDGQVRISGQFDIHLLLGAVDAEIEIKEGG